MWQEAAKSKAADGGSRAANNQRSYPVLKSTEAARLLKISRWKLDELRLQNKLPANCYFEIPSESEAKRIFRYKVKELLAWMGIIKGPITTASKEAISCPRNSVNLLAK